MLRNVRQIRSMDGLPFLNHWYSLCQGEHGTYRFRLYDHLVLFQSLRVVGTLKKVRQKPIYRKPISPTYLIVEEYDIGQSCNESEIIIKIFYDISIVWNWIVLKYLLMYDVFLCHLPLLLVSLYSPFVYLDNVGTPARNFGYCCEIRI